MKAKKFILFFITALLFLSFSCIIVTDESIDEIYGYGLTAELDKCDVGATYTEDYIYFFNAAGENITNIRQCPVSSVFDDHTDDTTTEPNWSAGTDLTLSGGFIANGLDQNFSITVAANETIFYKVTSSSGKFVVLAIVKPDVAETSCWRVIIRKKE